VRKSEKWWNMRGEEEWELSWVGREEWEKRYGRCKVRVWIKKK
jgi:hypothetical protein